DLQLSRSRYLTYGMIGIAGLILIVALLFIRQTKLKTEQKSIHLEQKLLRTQMSPHFIFNARQAIKNLKEKKKAIKYLSSFGALTRSVLENSRMEFIPLKKEIALLEHYLELQKLLHDQQFTYVINIAPGLDTENIDIPPMLAQPFIENAIEHGLRDVESGGLVEISFSREENKLLLEIKDNGTGISPAKN